MSVDVGEILRLYAEAGDASAAARLHAALDALEARELVKLDAAIRADRPVAGSIESGPHWEIDGRALGAIDERSHRTASLLVASCSRSGYQREVWLRRLRLRPGPHALRAFALRLTDHVTEVRAEAKQGWRETCAHATTVELMRAIAVLDATSVRARGEVASARAVAMEALRARPASEMQSALSSNFRDVRRLVLLVAPASWPVRSLVAWAVASDDARVRAAAATRLTELDPGELPTLLHHRDPRVRLAALRLLLDGPRERRMAAAFEASEDVTSSVRWHAQWWLKRERVDLAARYRERLRSASEPARLVAIVLGLGELLVDDAAPALRALSGHESARVRAAVVSALVLLDRSRGEEDFTPFFADASARVSRLATRALAAGSRMPGASVVEAWLRDPSLPRHARRHALRLAERLPKWDSLATLLLAAGSSERELAELAAELVTHWLDRASRGASRLDDGRAREIADRLREARLPNGLAVEVRGWIRSA